MIHHQSQYLNKKNFHISARVGKRNTSILRSWILPQSVPRTSSWWGVYI